MWCRDFLVCVLHAKQVRWPIYMFNWCPCSISLSTLPGYFSLSESKSCSKLLQICVHFMADNFHKAVQTTNLTKLNFEVLKDFLRAAIKPSVSEDDKLKAIFTWSGQEEGETGRFQYFPELFGLLRQGLISKEALMGHLESDYDITAVPAYRWVLN